MWATLYKKKIFLYKHFTKELYYNLSVNAHISVLRSVGGDGFFDCFGGVGGGGALIKFFMFLQGRLLKVAIYLRLGVYSRITLGQLKTIPYNGRACVWGGGDVGDVGLWGMCGDVGDVGEVNNKDGGI